MLQRQIPAADLARVRELAATGQARRIRERARLSSREVAESIGCTQPAVIRWESGERRPTGRRAIAYLRLLDRLRELAGGEVGGAEGLASVTVSVAEVAYAR